MLGVQRVRAQGLHRAVGALRRRARARAAAAAALQPARQLAALLHVVSLPERRHKVHSLFTSFSSLVELIIRYER